MLVLDRLILRGSVFLRGSRIGLDICTFETGREGSKLSGGWMGIRRG